jgi:Lsr2
MTQIRRLQTQGKASQSILRVGELMQRVDVRLEDDLTGGPADETVEFGIDGRSYEIDLTARHAADFRGQLARFLEHASPVRPAHRRPPVRTLANRVRSRQIRAWAEEQGLDVSERGRLPGEVIQQYESEHGASQQSERTARHQGARRVAASTRALKRTPSKANRAGRGQRRGR